MYPKNQRHYGDMQIHDHRFSADLGKDSQHVIRPKLSSVHFQFSCVEHVYIVLNILESIYRCVSSGFGLCNSSSSSGFKYKTVEKSSILAVTITNTLKGMIIELCCSVFTLHVKRKYFNLLSIVICLTGANVLGSKTWSEGGMAHLVTLTLASRRSL